MTLFERGIAITRKSYTDGESNSSDIQDMALLKITISSKTYLRKRLVRLVSILASEENLKNFVSFKGSHKASWEKFLGEFLGQIPSRFSQKKSKTWKLEGILGEFRGYYLEKLLDILIDKSLQEVRDFPMTMSKLALPSSQDDVFGVLRYHLVTMTGPTRMIFQLHK